MRTINNGKILHAIFISLLSLLINIPKNTNAEVYRYEDETGRAHYVDSWLKIPTEFRKESQKPHNLPPVIRNNHQNISKNKIDSISEKTNNEFDSSLVTEASWRTKSSLTQSHEDTEQTALPNPLVMLTKNKPFLYGLLIGGILMLISLWILLERAGLPGYGVIIPVYNLILISRLGGYSGWWTLWCFVPVIGFFIWSISVHYGIAKNFGRSDLFAVGSAFLPSIFFPIIAFGKS